MKTLSFSLAFILLLCFTSKATDYYWVASLAGNWSNPANWSTTSGGSGGAGIPDIADNAFFNNQRNGNCNVDLSSVTINSISVSGYTGTISISDTFTTTIATFTSGRLSGGTFVLNGGSASFTNMVVSSNISGSASGLTFTGISPTGTVTITLASGTGTISSCTFNAATSITNNSTQQLSISNNTYQAPVTFTSTNSGEIRETGINVYNSDLSAINNSTGQINFAYNSTSKASFNGNLTLNCSSTGSISTGTNIIPYNTVAATLASGKNLILVDNGIGNYTLRCFKQNGNLTPLTFKLTSNASLALYGSTFNSEVMLELDNFNLRYSTFNNQCHFKSSTSKTNQHFEDCIFNGVTDISYSGNSQLLLGYAGAMTFNDDVTFNQFSTGTILVSTNGDTSYSGNVTVNCSSSNGIQFGQSQSASTTTFTGVKPQSWNVISTFLPSVYRLIINKNQESLTLNSPLIVTTRITLTKGILNSSSTNYLHLLNNATTSGGSNSSYVEGPFRKTGNQAFTFPVGNNGIYRPVTISAPSNATDVFTAQFFRTAAPNYSATSSPIEIVSGCEYWDLERTAGTSSVQVTLGWKSSDCTSTSYVTNPANLVVAHWNGTTWESKGNGGTTGTAAAGTVISLGAVSDFSPFALGTITIDNPLPVQLTSFTANPKNTSVELTWDTASELNSNYFAVERSKGQDIFETIGIVKGKGTTNEASQYRFIDVSPLNGTSYYRLRQVDTDGTVTYTSIKRIEMNLELEAYPNPASSVISFSQESNVQLLNTFGQQVVQEFNTNSLDVSSLPSGQYLLKSDKGLMRKIMIVH